ncbi:hypothetical protein IT400_01495 [Candidatus Nomurabacteria bacterium]|nr:hypothetical protein [Candidatus Nomurabacteria bacterium]
MDDTKKISKIAQQLLLAFRDNSFLDFKKEEKILNENLKTLAFEWDKSFGVFPERKMKNGSFLWKFEKAKRSKHLIKILKGVLNGHRDSTIVNPACYDGKRARQIALNIPHSKVIACDIDPHWNKNQSIFRKLFFKKEPQNYSFIQDDVFNSQIQSNPEVTVFFGACGSVSDAIMDFAIKEKSTYLVCRICCHENIGGNTVVRKRNSLLNFYFRFKNRSFQKKKESKTGYYFSDTYSKSAYPRSNAIKQISNSEEYEKIAQNSIDSSLCATLIDLDRCCYLIEKGYKVFYNDELFVAQKVTKS